MRTIFLDDSSTFHPKGVQEPASPLHAAPPSSRQMWQGEGRQSLSALGSPQAPVHTSRGSSSRKPGRREEGGFQEPPRPIFQKENATSLGEQETHGVKKSRSQGGRWGTETEPPVGLALHYLAPQSVWWCANPQEPHPTPQDLCPQD